MRKIHGELLRAYPQIKLMCYFNVVMPNEAYNYALYENPKMNELYNEMVQNPYFISSFGESADFSYQKFDRMQFCAGEILKLSAFAYYPKKDSITVRYSLDDKELSSSNLTPYACELHLENGMGEHILKVEAYDGDTKIIEREYPFSVGYRKIKVFINDEQVEFADQQPAMVEDRILIPARGLFEAVGAMVDWEEHTNTAMIQKDNTTISIQEQSKQMQIQDENGSRMIDLDVPARKMNDRIMLPLRVVLEAMGAQVKWNEQEGSAFIYLSGRAPAGNSRANNS